MSATLRRPRNATSTKIKRHDQTDTNVDALCSSSCCLSITSRCRSSCDSVLPAPPLPLLLAEPVDARDETDRIELPPPGEPAPWFSLPLSLPPGEAALAALVVLAAGDFIPGDDTVDDADDADPVGSSAGEAISSVPLSVAVSSLPPGELLGSSVTVFSADACEAAEPAGDEVPAADAGDEAAAAASIFAFFFASRRTRAASTAACCESVRA